MSDCELLKSELIRVSNGRFWGVVSVFHVGVVEAIEKVEIVETRGGEDGRSKGNKTYFRLGC